MPVPTGAALKRLRLRGVKVYVVVYDTLPLTHPEWFAPGTDGLFDKWVHLIAQAADGLLCISQATADGVREEVRKRQPWVLDRLAIEPFFLGADLDRASGADEPIPEAFRARLDVLSGDAPVFAAIGTLEPRKGYGQLLDAFEVLWASGSEAKLAIVGKHGWLVDALAARLRQHPEHDRRLVWFESAPDAVLEAVYRRAACIVLPSEGEGFGLPLIEAAHHGRPVIARDLPVFREIAGNGAHYFTGTTGPALADAITAWLRLREAGRAPDPGLIRQLSWDESTGELLRRIEELCAEPR